MLQGDVVEKIDDFGLFYKSIVKSNKNLSRHSLSPVINNKIRFNLKIREECAHFTKPD
ncbi:hypothetical protein TUM19329_11060 [Legionella antarctica]|uniref:Uncharacterized protein n=1 Tax=Legionella antarctica TaxID=2708020 RepID=A0A6F8T256_9GAMM|nr:hypothetical protein TUM19329_11060 [Legionella antarctica]